MRTIMQDVRYGARVLAKSPGFTLVAVAALALGIGATTCLFSVVNGLLLRPLPYERPERLVMVYGTDPEKARTRGALSYPDFRDFERQGDVFASLAAFTGASGVLTEGDAQPEQLDAIAAAGDLLGVLGVRPALGRVGFTPEEERAGGVAVITDGLWRRRFDADPRAVGKSITFDRARVTIVGVLPAGFRFLEEAGKPELFLPLDTNPQSMEGELIAERGASFLKVVARLKEDASIERAQAEMETINSRLVAEHPETNTGNGVRVVSLHEDATAEMRPALFVLLGAVALVLLVACANVANLLLARATGRGKEIAVRTALGASRWRVVRGLLTESLLLALAGGACGLLLAAWGLSLLLTALPEDFPRLADVRLDFGVFAFALLVSLVTGVVFGLAPALQASKIDLTESLKESGRGSTAGRRRARLRGALVVSEIALSLMLLVGAGLLVKSFLRLRDVSPGFDAAPVLSATVSLPEGGDEDGARHAEFFRRALEEINRQPGVERVAVVMPLPFGDSDYRANFAREDRPRVRGEVENLRLSTVSPDYFGVMSIPSRRGRLFTERDRAGAPNVIVINDTLARRYYDGEDPVGKRIAISTIAGQRSCEIVGVVGDTKHRRLDEDAEPQAYVPYAQLPIGEMSLIARGRTSDPAGLGAALRAGVQATDKNQPIYDVRLLSDRLADSIARQRFSTLLLAVFAAAAALLAAVGIFGVMSFAVAQRTHEIGVRLALGARGTDVLRLVLGQGMFWIIAGVALGLAGAFALSRVLASLLYGVSTIDAGVFVGVTLLLTSVALLACYIPARRAAKVDPLVALRYE